MAQVVQAVSVGTLSTRQKAKPYMRRSQAVHVQWHHRHARHPFWPLQRHHTLPQSKRPSFSPIASPQTPTFTQAELRSFHQYPHDQPRPSRNHNNPPAPTTPPSQHSTPDSQRPPQSPPSTSSAQIQLSLPNASISSTMPHHATGVIAIAASTTRCSGIPLSLAISL